MDLVSNLSQGLGMFAEALAGVNPELGAAAQKIADEFKSLIAKLGQGGGAPEQSGPVPMEQGATKSEQVGPHMR